MCTIPYHITLYHTIPFYTIPYHTHTTSYHTIPYHHPQVIEEFKGDKAAERFLDEYEKLYQALRQSHKDLKVGLVCEFVCVCEREDDASIEILS